MELERENNVEESSGQKDKKNRKKCKNNKFDLKIDDDKLSFYLEVSLKKMWNLLFGEKDSDSKS